MTPRLLGLALRCWPRELRDRDGAVLVDTASQLIEDGHSRALVESIAIARSGLALRLRRRERWAAVPWSGAAALLLAPLLAIALIVAAGQLVWSEPGFAAVLLAPGFSGLLLIGLILLAAVAAAVSRPALAGWTAAAAFLLVVARIVRAESFGARPGVQGDLVLWLGGQPGASVNADATLLPVLALAAGAGLVLGRSGDRARLAPAGVALALAASAFWLAREAPRLGVLDVAVAPGQAPAELLLWVAPVLLFAATLLLRVGGPVRLAASLGLVLAGPSLAWMVAGRAAFYDWPDPLVLALQAGLNLLWVGAMIAGIVSSAVVERAPADGPAP